MYLLEPICDCRWVAFYEGTYKKKIFFPSLILLQIRRDREGLLSVLKSILGVCVLSHVQLRVTLWAVAHQASLSMGFSRQENWSGLPCPPPGDLPDPGVEPVAPVLQVGFYH